jgi:hypothetical protein
VCKALFAGCRKSLQGSFGGFLHFSLSDRAFSRFEVPHMNPILGVFFHWLGGLASGSFYVPFRGVKRWSWETAWLVAGVFSWIIAPWFFALLNTTDVVTVLKETSGNTWFFTYLFGALWGFGGLTFGLAMRYLGMSLGMAVALGYCTVFGMLIPPIYKGEFVSKLIEPVQGRWVLAGLCVCVLGIIITALAGRQKEQEMDESQKQETVKEFDFKKGILVATFSGIMSACFAFGLSNGDSIRDTTIKLDLVNSAAAAGKTAQRAAEPTEDEVFQLGNVLKPDDAKNYKLSESLTILEKPLNLKHAKPDPKADPAKLASVKSEADTKLSELLGKLETSDVPLAKRLLAYHADLLGLAADEKPFAVMAKLESLSAKETGINLIKAGADLPAIHSKHELWTGLPVLIVVLLGGFTTNFVWCLILNLKNRTGYQYFTSKPGENSPLSGAHAGGEGGPVGAKVTDGRLDRTPVPLLGNYFFAALAGVTWYFQFFFYSMGETQMGEYKFSSWTLHMASIIIFSSVWGLALGEWKGASPKSKKLLFGGIGVLILSTLIVGVGNYLGSGSAGH